MFCFLSPFRCLAEEYYIRHIDGCTVDERGEQCIKKCLDAAIEQRSNELLLQAFVDVTDNDWASYMATYAGDGKETVWIVRRFEEDDGVFDETCSTDYLRKLGMLVRLISDKMPSIGGVIIAGIPLEGPQLGQTGGHAESIIS
ncbi:unnamed protein product [Sphagnum jensenii]|uniref:Uncharacterized protein n=1 Tax=Sphagnum jensenii TaxID=128206 RepID=A0ABP1BAL0_9BRYO